MTGMYKSRQGMILVSVMWIVVVLTMIVYALGRYLRADITMLNYFNGKTHAKAAAWGGIMVAVDQIKMDTLDAQCSAVDTHTACGVCWQNPMMLQTPHAIGRAEITQIHFSDEDSRLNVNAIDESSQEVLVRLMVILDFDEALAARMAQWITVWTGKAEGNQPTLAMPLKGRPLDSLEELLLMSEMDVPKLERLRPYLTVWPKKAAQLTVNLDTASPEIMQALVEYHAQLTDAQSEEARSLTEKVMAKRLDMAQGLPQSVEESDLPLIGKERAIWRALQVNRTRRSSFIRVQVQAKDQLTNVGMSMNAVIKRDDLSIVEWNKT